jgi:pyruvate/2-oxoacid:ferredoxin oxidoreductase beta subunit
MEEKTYNNHTMKDFKSNQEVRWCPGCGNHAVLNAVQKALAQMNIPRENYVFVSGIAVRQDSLIILIPTAFMEFMAELQL